MYLQLVRAYFATINVGKRAQNCTLELCVHVPTVLGAKKAGRSSKYGKLVEHSDVERRLGGA